jgi:hypothetical protein
MSNDERQVKIQALETAETKLTKRFDLFYAEDLKKLFRKRKAEKQRIEIIAKLMRAEAALNAGWEKLGIEPPVRRITDE